MRIMQLEVVTEGVEFVVSRVPQAKNDADGRQKADRDTGEPLFTTELVAMGHSGAEVFKVTTAGAPPVAKRQAVTVRGLVANPWNVDGRGGVAFRARSITPLSAPASGPSAGAARAASAGRVPDGHLARRGRHLADAGGGRAHRAGAAGRGRRRAQCLRRLAGRRRGGLAWHAWLSAIA